MTTVYLPPDLRARAAADDKEAAKELDTLLTEHAENHLKLVLLAELPLEAGTTIFIVDALHALNLNVAKCGWKYSYGDRMTPQQRSKATTWLNSIDCPLDVRAKGERGEQKWFRSSEFDTFVLGKQLHAKAKSNGLAENTWAMVDIVFPAHVPPVQSSAAQQGPFSSTTTPARAAAPAASSSRRNRPAPAAGFGDGSRSDSNESDEPELELPTLPTELKRGAATNESVSAAIAEFARERWRGRATEALNVIRFWQTFGDLFLAWRDPWPSSTPSQAYKACRAMRFLRAGACAINYAMYSYTALHSLTHTSVQLTPRSCCVSFGTEQLVRLQT